MSAHTPGPWRVSETHCHCVETAAKGYWFSWSHLPHQHERYGINPEADARLIAAAPDSHAANTAMVAALDWAYGLAGRDDDYIYDTLPTSAVANAYFAARAAIAKATGETK